jgi:hypothetical protein
MKAFLLIIALTLGTPPAFAQRDPGLKGGAPGKNQGMSRDERQRLRNDMQDVNRDRNRQERPQRQLSPQEREQLRRDIQDANRNLKR